MAPEVIKHEPYSASADVYSFAMVLYELITHHPPFADRSPLQAAAAAGLENKRPLLPPDTPLPLLALIGRAWAPSRNARPGAAELFESFQSMACRLSPSEVEWLDAPNGHPCNLAPNGPLPAANGAPNDTTAKTVPAPQTPPMPPPGPSYHPHSPAPMPTPPRPPPVLAPHTALPAPPPSLCDSGRYGAAAICQAMAQCIGQSPMQPARALSPSVQTALKPNPVHVGHFSDSSQPL